MSLELVPVSRYGRFLRSVPDKFRLGLAEIAFSGWKENRKGRGEKSGEGSSNRRARMMEVDGFGDERSTKVAKEDGAIIWLLELGYIQSDVCREVPLRGHGQ